MVKFVLFEKGMGGGGVSGVLNWSAGELWWVNWCVPYPMVPWNFHGKDRGTTKLEVQKDSL